MTQFSAFTNPFQDPTKIPQEYRDHIRLQGLFQPDGSYTRPAEDPVTMWAIDLLHTQYNVPLEAMQLELSIEFSEGTRTSGRGYFGRADLTIYDDRYQNELDNLDVAFIMVEAMEPSKKFEGDEDLGWNYHLKQLNSYMSASPSARYAILTSGKHTIIYRRDLEYPRALQPIADLPLYESAREAAERSPYKVIISDTASDGVETGLQPLTRDKFREVLGDTRSGCHSILRDNEGLQPQEAVDAMVKFLFAKWYDERATIDLVKETGEQRAYVFSLSDQTDPERLAIQVRETFELAKQYEQALLKEKSEEQLNIRAAFGEQDVLMFKPHTTMQIVRRLQPWSLRRSSADVKGGVFEDFLGKTFRDDLGQYFTPTPIINLMVGIMQPTVRDVIGDPACGSARMLTHALEYVRQQEYQKAQKADPGTTDIDPDYPTTEFRHFCDNNLFGAEISRNVMHVARINAIMNGAPHIDLKVIDTLVPLGSITGGVNSGLPERPGFYPGGLTMILTNPPFGSKVTNKQTLEDLTSRDGVTRKNGKTVRSIPQEVAFVNRCLEFLTPGGKLGIVLPDGVLANSSMQYVRDWILRWAKLKAIVSLPQETFSPYGAGVKTSVVFLEKRTQPLQPDDDALSTEDYEVYMARIDDIGYDARGLSTDKNEIPDVIKDFSTRMNETEGFLNS
ncbi:MAG: N-6 DNA methylase [Chloroflexota bacterium]